MKRLVIVALGLAAVGIASVFSTAPTAAQESEIAYVGPDACKKCHFKEHRAWKKTGLAKSLDVLKPTAEADDADLFKKKTAAKLDPAKDYSKDATCLQCHTTGYGKPGGYPADASKDAERAELMGSVSCEACHGPGGKYVAFKKAEMEKDKDAKFTFEQQAPMGLIQPDDANCKTCHNDKNPGNASDPYKFDKSKDLVHPQKKKKKKKK